MIFVMLAGVMASSAFFSYRTSPVCWSYSKTPWHCVSGASDAA